MLIPDLEPIEFICTGSIGPGVVSKYELFGRVQVLRNDRYYERLKCALTKMYRVRNDWCCQHAQQL